MGGGEQEIDLFVLEEKDPSDSKQQNQKYQKREIDLFVKIETDAVCQAIEPDAFHVFVFKEKRENQNKLPIILPTVNFLFLII